MWKIKNPPPIPVTHQFVSFVIINGNLIELDGTQQGPIIVKKGVDKGDTLTIVAEEVNNRVKQGIIGQDLSVLFMTYV